MRKNKVRLTIALIILRVLPVFSASAKNLKFAVVPKYQGGGD
ncbi:MAG: hypothetical protein ACJAT7_001672 [Psychromonas sp.]|jgi:hypothetical protein